MFYIAHFNDVYDIQEQAKEPVAGIPRFISLLRQLQSLGNVVTVFSGDVFSPSALSNIYHGEQMILPLKECRVDIACPGNHDFDYELPQIEKLIVETGFPWILSNVYNAKTGKNLANTQPRYTHTVNGVKIGFFALAEHEWLEEIVLVPQEMMDYEDYVHAAEREVEILRNDGCTFIVAITHMRVPNDRNLASRVQGIDLILGGHDHMVFQDIIGETFILKSGNNFRQLGFIGINLPIINTPIKYRNLIKHQFKNYTLDQVIFDITSDIEPLPDIAHYVEDRMKEYNILAQRVLCITDQDLDARFCEVRGKETNIANFYADLLRCEFKTDIAFINTGTIRIDELIHQGLITYSTIDNLFSLPDLLITYRITGKDLLLNMENSVSRWPTFDGRFAAISGFTFSFDPKAPSGNRVRDLRIHGQPVDLQKEYTTASQLYIATGFDGFPKVEEDKFILGKQFGILIPTVVIKVLECISNDPEAQKLEGDIKSDHVVLNNPRWNQYKSLFKGLRKTDKVYLVISPQVEGRITMLQ